MVGLQRLLSALRETKTDAASAAALRRLEARLTAPEVVELLVGLALPPKATTPSEGTATEGGHGNGGPGATTTVLVTKHGPLDIELGMVRVRPACFGGLRIGEVEGLSEAAQARYPTLRPGAAPLPHSSSFARPLWRQLNQPRCVVVA